MIIEDAISPEGSGPYDMAIGQNEALLRVYDKACSLARVGIIGIEWTCLAKVYGHNAFYNSLNHGLPFRGLRCRNDWHVPHTFRHVNVLAFPTCRPLAVCGTV